MFETDVGEYQNAPPMLIQYGCVNPDY
jgi:hypothetical protein